jgi:hypothetical protein
VKPSRAVGSGSGVAGTAGEPDAAGEPLATGEPVAAGDPDAAGEPEAVGEPDAACDSAGNPVAPAPGEDVRPGVGVGGRGVTDSTGPGVSCESQTYAAVLPV